MTRSATSRLPCPWSTAQRNTPSWKAKKTKLETEIARLREVHTQKLSKEAQKLAKMPFSRAITKKEQANMGALKKSVRGLVVVHPMTALGREMGLQVMTGFAKSEF
ncbi:Protein of uncharacterised function (DUF2810) [Kluyvera cryocrescens]|uniref:Protein of uncharacterized function (DUF2810) n=1 Tax=Kluyvera cryocrescens TaxID=580 RepID=A0A485AQV2_KLUCR|nr:Protein of uncharacterised function (DUF2810) [Kluyvera cryocrescens]